MNKILIFTAFHKRPEISYLYWMGIERLRKKFDIRTLAVVSDNVIKNGVEFGNKDLALKHSDHIFEAENEPVGRKMNEGLEYGMGLEFDYMMQMGSDDLLTDRALEKAEAYFDLGGSFFGFTNFLFVDSVAKKAKKSLQHNVFGCGRCIKRSMLEEVKYAYEVTMLESIAGTNFNYGKGAKAEIPTAVAEKWARRGLCKIERPGTIKLWEDERNQGLDRSSEAKLESMGYVCTPILTDEPECIDVKSRHNLWPYSGFQGEEVGMDYLKGKISKQELDYIMAL